MKYFLATNYLHRYKRLCQHKRLFCQIIHRCSKKNCLTKIKLLRCPRQNLYFATRKRSFLIISSSVGAVKKIFLQIWAWEFTVSLKRLIHCSILKTKTPNFKTCLTFTLKPQFQWSRSRLINVLESSMQGIRLNCHSLLLLRLLSKNSDRNKLYHRSIARCLLNQSLTDFCFRLNTF